MKISTAVLAATLAAGSIGFAAQSWAQTPSQDQQAPKAGQNQLTPADRDALVDARIAGLKAGLKLTPDQEKLWPGVETAIRNAATKRQARMEEMRKVRQDRNRQDMLERLRSRADVMVDVGNELKRLADAAAPLYATLDDGQKRRLQALIRFGAGSYYYGWHHGGRGGGTMRM